MTSARRGLKRSGKAARVARVGTPRLRWHPKVPIMRLCGTKG